MKQLITIFTFISLFLASDMQAENYWVEVAAYGQKVDDDYFDAAGLQDVVLHLDHNLIYRYYIKELPGKNQAEVAKSKAIDKGFKYAKVVDMDIMYTSCKTPCINGKSLDEEPLVEVIYFDFDGTGLREKSQEKLDQVSTLLQTIPDLEVKINGHTDAKGSEDYNDALSRQRAERARQYLLAQQIPSDQVGMSKFGETLPVALNQNHRGEDLPEGRQYNRRVELIVSKRGQELTFDEVKKVLFADIPPYLRISL